MKFNVGKGSASSLPSKGTSLVIGGLQSLYRLSRKVDSHSKTLQGLQQHCKLAVQRQTFSLHETNAIAKLLCSFAPTDRVAIREKALLGTFAASGKSTIVPLLTESRKEPVSLLRERKGCSSSKRKEKSCF